MLPGVKMPYREKGFSWRLIHQPYIPDLTLALVLVVAASALEPLRHPVSRWIEDLKFKVTEMKGMKKPALKKVRMSADQMLQALLGSKHKVTMDLRSNLKQVKKETKEETADVGDWRKNVEEMAGMGGRKKMFEGAEA